MNTWTWMENGHQLVIRNGRQEDRDSVERITREAFYNIYIPGCVEHYLVHIMRDHPDFVAQLDFVLERDGEIVGNIMYTKARLVDETGEEKGILTFGPICVAPVFQRRGYGKKLIAHSLNCAKELGCEAVVIFGTPANYVTSGFVSCQRHDVHMESGKFPTAMLVRELVPGALTGHSWTYYDSPVMAIREEDAMAYDATLPPLEKKRLPCQEEFFILSHSSISC